MREMMRVPQTDEPVAVPTPPTVEEIEAAAGALQAVCERLPASETRANALAHIRTAERWALRALEASDG